MSAPPPNPPPEKGAEWNVQGASVTLAGCSHQPLASTTSTRPSLLMSPQPSPCCDGALRGSAVRSDMAWNVQSLVGSLPVGASQPRPPLMLASSSRLPSPKRSQVLKVSERV